MAKEPDLKEFGAETEKIAKEPAAGAEPVAAYEPFKGGAYDVALPASAPQKLLLFGGAEVAPGGPPHTVHLPAGDGGEHQLLDLQRHFIVTPAKPKAATPDPRMTAAK